LFGENQAQVLITCAPEDEVAINNLAMKYQLGWWHRGMVGGNRLRMQLLNVPVWALTEAYETGLAAALQRDPPHHRWIGYSSWQMLADTGQANGVSPANQHHRIDVSVPPPWHRRGEPRRG
jgi:hypothetical protein